MPRHRARITKCDYGNCRAAAATAAAARITRPTFHFIKLTFKLTTSFWRGNYINLAWNFPSLVTFHPHFMSFLDCFLWSDKSEAITEPTSINIRPTGLRGGQKGVMGDLPRLADQINLLIKLSPRWRPYPCPPMIGTLVMYSGPRLFRSTVNPVWCLIRSKNLLLC